MADSIDIAGVAKAEATLLVLFIPSVDRKSQEIDQEKWEMAALTLLGRCLGGATAFPRARGVWRDDLQGGTLIFDNPIVIQCYTNLAAIKVNLDELRGFLVQMGTETHQGAVGFVLDRTYMEIQFPLPQNGSGQ
jgi:hypothetical protein